MIESYVLDKILERIRGIIGIDDFDNTKILIDTDSKFSDDITFGNVVKGRLFKMQASR